MNLCAKSESSYTTNVDVMFIMCSFIADCARQGPICHITAIKIRTDFEIKLVVIESRIDCLKIIICALGFIICIL